jgi:hypothetical protein
MQPVRIKTSTFHQLATGIITVRHCAADAYFHFVVRVAQPGEGLLSALLRNVEPVR